MSSVRRGRREGIRLHRCARGAASVSAAGQRAVYDVPDFHPRAVRPIMCT